MEILDGSTRCFLVDLSLDARRVLRVIGSKMGVELGPEYYLTPSDYTERLKDDIPLKEQGVASRDTLKLRWRTLCGDLTVQRVEPPDEGQDWNDQLRAKLPQPSLPYAAPQRGVTGQPSLKQDD